MRIRESYAGSLSVDEHGRSDNGGPERFFVADGGLRDVLSADDFGGEAVHLFFFVPAFVGIEIETERRPQHFGGGLFSVVACRVFLLSEAVGFGEGAVKFVV